jgi:tetratricopeptide (TPR) repeat protein
VTGEERGLLLLAQAEAYRWREQMQDAEQAAEEAIEHLREGGPSWCVAMGELVTAQGKLTQREMVQATSQRLLSFARTLGDEWAAPTRRADELGPEPGPARGMETDLALVSALARASIQAVHLGNSALARELLGHADAIVSARTLDDPAILARYAQARSVLALYAGDMAASARESERAVARFLLERVNLGNAWTELGAYAEAEQETREALATADRLGLRTAALAATINLGFILTASGRCEEGVAIERSLTDRPVQLAPRFETAARLYLARALDGTGQHAEAAAEAQRVLDLTERIPPLRAYALAVHARALLGCGVPERAAAAASQAMDLLTSLGGVDSGESLIRLTYAEALFAVGAQTEARAALAAARERLLARAERIGDPRLREKFLGTVPENARTLALALPNAPSAVLLR